MDCDFNLLLSFVSIIDLNLRCKNVKLMEGNIREKLDDPGYNDKFLNIIPKASLIKKNN